ncbi:MAG: hypothetical protein NT010_04005 [Proteobacteria bacterium]|nr:hypothetical protein [Pseudomonadota bacterium]
MPTHEIYMTMPTKIVLNKDTDFEVYSDDEKLGTLRISKGTIEWVPSTYSYGYHLSWEEFNEIMQNHGYR